MGFWENVGMLAHAAWKFIRTIWRGFVQFASVVVRWAQQMYNRIAAKIRQGWRMYYVEIDASRIPPDIVPRDTLQGAKKVHLGLVADRNGTPVQVDELFIPTEGVDAETRRHLREGNGAIELEI